MTSNNDASDLIEKEKKKIDLLENAIASVVREKIIASDGGVKVNLSPKELRDIVAAQKDLNDMRRKNAGLGE